MRTGIVRDERYMNHGTGFGHPESPKRLEVIYRMLSEPDLADKFIDIPPRLASVEELSMVHRLGYIDMLAQTAGRPYTSLDPDTATTAESFEVARLAVGGLLNAIDAVLEKRVDNAFALVRPPGHHAEAAEAMGFCLFNNVALGAMHAIKKRNLERVLIVDWDLHHGNGTQHAFYESNQVLYFSTHQYPYYPGTGSLEEVGRGAGEGYTINVPLRPGADDYQYLRIFRDILKPVALHFRPELVLVSAGFDIYKDDPLGGMEVTPTGFGWLTKVLMEIAAHSCEGRLVMTLEGGYHLEGQKEGVRKVLLSMLGEDKDVLPPEAPQEDPLLKKVIAKIGVYWPVF